MVAKPVPKMRTSAGWRVPVRGHHRIGLDPGDRRVDHRHVGPEQGRVPVVGDEDALAADRDSRGPPPPRAAARPPPRRGCPGRTAPGACGRRSCPGGTTASASRGTSRSTTGRRCAAGPIRSEGPAHAGPVDAVLLGVRRSWGCAGRRWSTPPAAATGGTNWMALAPEPITATCRPVRSTEWSQRAECHDGPANVSIPSMSGTWGRLSWPQANTTVSTSSSSSPPAVRQVEPPGAGRSRRSGLRPRWCPSRRWGPRW